MNEITLTNTYQFDAITMGFTADKQLYTKVMFVKKTTPLESVSSIVMKDAPLSDKLQMNIKTSKNGKESMFQAIMFDRTDEQGKLFVEELKAKVPAFVWNNKVEAAEAAEAAMQTNKRKHSYPLQLWFFMTKGLAGMPRGVQVGVNYGVWCILIIPIPLLIYVIAAGCHRVTTSEDGITIKKLFGSFFAWDNVDRIEVIRYNIIITNYGVKANEAFMLQCTLVSKDGRKKKFIIRTKEGKQFVQEMVGRKKVSAEMEKIFI